MDAPLLVVDAPSLLYRAFFALPDSITDGDERPVNALLGTANLLLQAVEQHAPRAVVLCFGAEAATYRTELFAGYHADRPPMPDDLRHQWDAGARLLRRLRLEPPRRGRARGRRPPRHPRHARAGGRRQRAALHR